MYTATLVGQPEKDIRLQRLTIVVQITNGTDSFTKKFEFNILETAENIKKAVKSYLDEVNASPAIITGDVAGYITPVPPIPTQEELNRIEWEQDVSKLKKAQELINCGVILSAGQLSALATLRTKIATNFKSEYLG